MVLRPVVVMKARRGGCENASREARKSLFCYRAGSQKREYFQSRKRFEYAKKPRLTLVWVYRALVLPRRTSLSKCLSTRRRSDSTSIYCGGSALTPPPKTEHGYLVLRDNNDNPGIKHPTRRRRMQEKYVYLHICILFDQRFN